MLFVALLKALPGTTQQRIEKRVKFQHPHVGMEPIAEYWLQTPDPNVITVFKADHVNQIYASFAEWYDLFDISVYPATTATEGLEMLKQMAPK